MASLRDLRATRTRALATTAVDPKSGDRGEDDAPDSYDREALPKIDDIVGLHYRLVSHLGEGNFGKVYLAERIDVPEHRVALKILPRSLYAGRNVERELIMLATVGHPNMVQMKDHGMTENYVWLTMPVYEGETLGERLERGPLEFREAYDIFLPIARAVEALHGAGLRHQDIKPDNIFLARFAGRLHPVLLDLGVAAEKDSSFVAGTALYAAPEQLLAIIGVPGAIALTEKMDTYCFAATLLMALVGESRFPGAKATTRDEIVLSHRDRAQEPLRGCLPRLEGNARDMLEKRLGAWMALEPEERPGITAVAEGLEVLLEPEREIERAEIAAKEAQRRTLARTRIGALVFFIVAASLVVFGFYKRQSLRLASDLERAQKEGAKSFDKLDTCRASFDVERQEHQTCEADRDRERVENEQTIAALSKKDDNCTSIANELTSMRTRLTNDVASCRDELKSEKAEKNATELEKVKLGEECTADKTKLEASVQSCTEGRATDAKTAQSERQVCEDAKAKCVVDLDACEKATPVYPPVGPGPGPVVPHPPGSSDPGPAPSTTSVPVTPPTTPPTAPPTVPPPTVPPPTDDPYSG
ncbi:MAG: protein kinase [Polyangiaceae bacterium]